MVNLIAARESSYYNNSKKFIKRVYIVRHYSYCSKKGHNSRTYIVEIKDADNSNTSKEYYSIAKSIIFCCYVE
jgi:hypothetical protein